MDNTISLILLLSGLYTYTHCLSRQFHLIYELSNWTTAQNYCRIHYTDLATLRDANDLKRLRQQHDRVPPNVTYPFWTGLTKSNIITWKWSLSDRDFYQGGEAEYGNWQRILISGQCVVTSASLQGWRPADCLERHAFLCYDGRCSNQTYVPINIPATWSYAQWYCRAYHRDLVSVRNQAEDQLVTKLLLQRGLDFAWIGLFSDSLMWSDRSSSSFRVGLTPDLSSNCIHMKPYGYYLMNQSLCDAKMNFICYTDRTEKMVRLKLTLGESTLNFNDPGMKQALLDQIGERLKQYGNLRLTWKERSDGTVFKKVKKRELQ